MMVLMKSAYSCCALARFCRALLCFCLLGLLAACATTQPIESREPSGPLIAEEIGLVTPEVSAMLNAQAQSGINSAIRVVGQKALRASHYRHAFNRNYVAANFTLSRALLADYNEQLQQQLLATAYGKTPKIADNTLAFYSLLSWQPLDNGEAMLELVIAASDWRQQLQGVIAAKAQSVRKKEQGEPKVQGAEQQLFGQTFIASTQWFALHRKQVPVALLSGQQDEQLLALLTEMAEQTVRLFAQAAE